MAIISQGPNPASKSPSLTDILSPIARSVNSSIQHNREQQSQIAQNTHLAKTLEGISQLGPDATFAQIQKIISEGTRQGLNSKTSLELLKEYGTSLPKQQEAQDKLKSRQQSEQFLNKFNPQNPNNLKTNERSQSFKPEGSNPETPEEKMYEPNQNVIYPEHIVEAHKINPQLGTLMNNLYQGQQKEKSAREALELKKNIHEEEKADKAYAAEKPYIDEITNSYKAFEFDTKPRLMQLQNLNDGELIGAGSAALLDKLGIPLGILENPSNELYQKVSQDLLKGLPETYGSRILKVEVDNFLKTIPTLMNSPEGRRMIASNMLKLGQMKEVYYDEMRRLQKDYLETGKKFPKDFQQQVFEQVQPRLNKLSDQFAKLSNIKQVPKGSVPFFNPQGNISFVPNNPEAMKWAEQNGGEKNMVTPSFSWDSFQKNESEEKQDSVPSMQNEPQESKQYSWGEFQNTSTYQGDPDPTADESSFEYLGRNIAANTARAAESFLGRYGDVQKTINNVLTNYPGAFGYATKAMSEWLGPETWSTLINGRQGPLNPSLPTSEQLHEATKSFTGNKLEPKTPNEKRLQEFSGDIGSLGTRLSNLSRNGLINNFGIPAASNVVKNFVKDLGFGDDKATYTKLGTWTVLSLLNNVNGARHAANLMNEGRNGYGPNVVANVPRYQHSIDRTARNMLQGDPRSSLAQQQLAGIQNDIRSGQTSIQDLMNRYDAINAAKRDRGLFELSRNDRAAAIRNINQVRDSVRNEIQILGQANPQALESWRNGVQAFSVIHQSNAISNMAQRYANSPIAKIFGIGALGSAGYSAPALSLGAIASGTALNKSGQILYRVANDPTLARYYWQAISDAAAGNSAAFSKNFEKLDKEYKKKYSEKSKNI